MESQLLNDLDNLWLFEEENKVFGNSDDWDIDDRTPEFAFGTGEHLGGFIEYDDSDPLGWNEYLRVKVQVDINKPLRRGVRVATRRQGSKWCGIQYERLADFCYYCGRIEHTDIECQYVEEEAVKKGVVYEYGPWLGNLLKKPARLSIFEREKEKEWLAKLKGQATVKLPGYHDPNVIRKGPPVAARKLVFSPEREAETVILHKEDNVQQNVQLGALKESTTTVTISDDIEVAGILPNTQSGYSANHLEDASSPINPILVVDPLITPRLELEKQVLGEEKRRRLSR
uniref:Zinc knuckle CX2CX4HX4C domain-containing protein n=1 Tax=Chenopodium quinoa TaxID=63459 RepID=A0A803M694_CHEQI